MSNRPYLEYISPSNKFLLSIFLRVFAAALVPPHVQAGAGRGDALPHPDGGRLPRARGRESLGLVCYLIPSRRQGKKENRCSGFSKERNP
jgi:hypothetical protein